MKAAVMEEFGKPFVIHNDWPDPEYGPQDVVMRVEANGICRSDFHFWQGGWPWLDFVPDLPAVLGHEFCGVVEEAGPMVTRFKPGDRVVVPFGHGCGVCLTCMSGHQNVCEGLSIAGFHYSGGYGRYAKIPFADVNLVKLPDAISFLDAASMGCRFVTSWHGLVDQAAVQPGEWVAVFGCGGVGLAAVDICAALGANVVAVSHTPAKLSLAMELGAVAVVNAGDDDVVDKVKDVTEGGAHVSVDAFGEEVTCLNGIWSLRSRGRYLRLGLSGKETAGEVPIPVDLVTFKELEIIGSLGMQAARYPEMLRMVESGKVHPHKLVSGTVPIEKASEVLEAMKTFDNFGVTVVNAW